MGLAVGRVPANTTQSKAVLLWKDCLRKMRKDRWLQIVLEHKPKCQICRGRVKGSQGGGGGTAREARTKLHSQAKKPGKLHSQELSTLQLVLPSVLGAENRESGPHHHGALATEKFTQ